MKENVINKAESTTSIISEFIQFKHLDFLSNDIKSSGKLFYKEPDLIKWEYEEPFIYSAIFKGDKLYINDGGKKSNVDLSSNKAFKSLNSLVVRSVKGDLFDDVQFKISYFKIDNGYEVHFVPTDVSLKTFIDEFVILFDESTYEVFSVKMLESSEDYSLLIFKNQQFNEQITDAVFTN